MLGAVTAKTARTPVLAAVSPKRESGACTRTGDNARRQCRPSEEFGRSRGAGASYPGAQRKKRACIRAYGRPW